MSTLKDLLAQQASLAVALAAHEQPLIAQAQAALAAAGTQDLVTTITAIRDALPPSQAREQLGNIVVVLTAVPQVLDQEHARVTALLPASPG